MNGYGQDIMNRAALHDALADYEKVQRRKETMADIMARGDGYSMIGAALGNMLANKFGTNSKEAETRYLEEQFKYQQAQNAAAAEAKKQADAQKRALQLEDEKRMHGYELEKIDRKGALPTTMQRNLADPVSRAHMEAQLKKSNAPTVNVHSGKAQSAWDETLAKENVKSYIGWRDDANAAQTTLNTMNQLEPMINAMDTGKVSQAMAIAGQLWGSDKASDMQSVSALTGDLVMSELSRLKGNASDKELNYINNLQASYDKTPAANKRIMEYIRSKSDASISRFMEADGHRKEHGNLQGFTPSFTETSFSQRNEKSEQTQSQQEQSGYSDGTVIRNPSTGETMVMRNGQWVKQ